MPEIGSIVYFENLTFHNNIKDYKTHRPCIVLEMIDDKIFCVPLTSQIKSFNNHNFKYCLIPTVIDNYKKMSFASLENLTMKNLEEANDTGIKVSNEVVERIITKINQNAYLLPTEYIDILNSVHQERLREEKHQKKLQKQILRKQKKQYISHE